MRTQITGYRRSPVPAAGTGSSGWQHFTYRGLRETAPGTPPSTRSCRGVEGALARGSALVLAGIMLIFFSVQLVLRLDFY